MLETEFDARADHPEGLIALHAQASDDDAPRMRAAVVLLREIVGD